MGMEDALPVRAFAANSGDYESSRRAPALECCESAERVLFQSELVISESYRRLREYLASSPRTWVITGVAGFIGSNLLQELLALGQSVVGLDNFSTGHRTNLDDVVSRPLHKSASFRMIEGDIRDLDTCRTACVRPSQLRAVMSLEQ